MSRNGDIDSLVDRKMQLGLTVTQQIDSVDIPLCDTHILKGMRRNDNSRIDGLGCEIGNHQKQLIILLAQEGIL